MSKTIFRLIVVFNLFGAGIISMIFVKEGVEHFEITEVKEHCAKSGKFYSYREDRCIDWKYYDER